MQETWVWSLGQEDPLEKGRAYSNILAWRISWTEEPGGLQSTGSQRAGHNWATNTYEHFQMQITIHCLFPWSFAQFLISYSHFWNKTPYFIWLWVIFFLKPYTLCQKGFNWIENGHVLFNRTFPIIAVFSPSSLFQYSPCLNAIGPVTQHVVLDCLKEGTEPEKISMKRTKLSGQQWPLKSPC